MAAEPECAARRIAEGAAQTRKRRHRPPAGAPRSRHRTRPRRVRTLPGRLNGSRASRPPAGRGPQFPPAGEGDVTNTLYTIGYEKARLADVIATLTAAGIGTLIDVRAQPISRRPGFSKRQLEAAIEEARMRYLSLR